MIPVEPVVTAEVHELTKVLYPGIGPRLSDESPRAAAQKNAGAAAGNVPLIGADEEREHPFFGQDPGPEIQHDHGGDHNSDDDECLFHKVIC